MAVRHDHDDDDQLVQSDNTKIIRFRCTERTREWRVKHTQYRVRPEGGAELSQRQLCHTQ